MDFHFASAWEALSDAYPNRTATIADGRYTSWREYRAARGVYGNSLLSAHGM